MSKLLTLFTLLLYSFSVMAEVKVTQGWVRAMPPGSQMTAAYMNLENLSPDPLKLIAVRSSAANDCSIHETITKDGISRMQHLQELVLPPSQKINIQPGGIHIMLMGLNKPLHKGDSFPLQLEFSDGSVQNIDLKIGKDN